MYCSIEPKEQNSATVQILMDCTVPLNHHAFYRHHYVKLIISLSPGTGKIMRRVLRKIAQNERDLGDVSTLADSSVIEQLFSNRCSTAEWPGAGRGVVGKKCIMSVWSRVWGMKWRVIWGGWKKINVPMNYIYRKSSIPGTFMYIVYRFYFFKRKMVPKIFSFIFLTW